MTGITYVLLFAAVLTSTQTKTWPASCEYMFNGNYVKCSLNKTTVELLQPGRNSPFTFHKLLIQCEDTNIVCSDLPQLNTSSASPVYLEVSTCSPNALRCVNHIIHETIIGDIFLNTTSVPLTSEHLKNLNNVTSLFMILKDADTFTKSNMTAIRSLPSLRDISIKQGNIHLSPYMFSNSPDLRMIRLIGINITSLPADAFNGLASLKYLVIHSSNIHNVGAGALRGLDRAEQKHFDDCNISFIEPGAFPATSKLKFLVIENNRLESFPNGVLEGMDRLEDVSLCDNQVELKLGSSAFANLPALTKIKLFNNKIRLLPENLFEACGNLEEIYIMVNLIKNLPSEVFLGLSSLITLDLSNNRIEELPLRIFKKLYKLEYLKLSHNNIEDLFPDLFDDLINLKELRLNDNYIQEIGMRWSIVAMKSHKLDRSQIVSERLDYKQKMFHETTVEFFDDRSLSPFNALKYLCLLDISGNQLTKFYKSWKSEMPNIEMIDLSRNQLTDIQDFDVDFSSLNVVIDLQYNQITNVLLDPRISSAKDGQPVNSYLILNNNPINCDCHSYGLHRRLNGARINKEPIFILSNFSCIFPSELKGKYLQDVTANELVCSLNEQCPNNCTSCIVKAATNELIMKCPKIPSTLPDQNSINPYAVFEKPTLSLKLDDQPHSIEGFNINTLNLSYTGITNISFGPTKSLKIIDVSHNNLNMIPDEFFKANITLYLSDNPFECDCSFTAALHEYNFVADFKRTTCANGDRIAQISVAKLCNRKHTLVAYIGTSIVCSFFLTMVAVTIYKKYSRRFCVTISRTLGRRLSDASIILEGRIFAVKQFDIFISFAHQDVEFVTDNLLPKLELDFKQKVCVHYRDWTVGDLIPDQIIKSVESSRRTIIILTENLLSSEWSYLEFRTAHNLSIQEGRPRVIVILLNEETAKDERLGNDLKSYISLNTYLLWGDPNFWAKLKQILPKQGWK